MRSRRAVGMILPTLLLALVALAHAFPSTPGTASALAVSPADPVNDTLTETIPLPAGFRCKLGRTKQGRDLPSRDLYAATLHALLHYSLQEYTAPAEAYRTRGPEPPGQVVLDAVPLAVVSRVARNAHLAWGLYQSVIAFNSPNNVRETLARVFIDTVEVARIEYLQMASTPGIVAAAEGEGEGGAGGTGNVTALTSASAARMAAAMGHGGASKAGSVGAVPDLTGYSLRFVLVSGGKAIRRETAYDAVAFAILWTAQYGENHQFIGTRVLSVPGGGFIVRYVSYDIPGYDPMTYGFAATVAKALPMFLEKEESFQEAFALVTTADGRRTLAVVGLWQRGAPPRELVAVGGASRRPDTA